MADLIFKVNGEEIYADHESLLAEEVLKLAKEKGAIPGNPEDYILQGDKGKYKGDDDRVNLEEDNLFIAIPNKPTPVA
ncbi:MAG: hypothetical protein F4Z86_15480 [Gemmatimonadetes bacterium]|nr:hypothetical protein [Gemmatimonadota bacterium]MYB56939.1 hypothetical protein [Gemmatimonadota bacterium]